jgi:hypothetical protein
MARSTPMDIDLREYTAGGYFVTKYAPRTQYMAEELLPERLVSLSWDINPGTVRVYWGWDVEKHRDEALAFGIPLDKLPDLVEWSAITHENYIGHPVVFYTLDAARQFIKEFLPVRDDLVLVGAALPNSLVEEFLSQNKQWGQDANGQRYDVLYGVNYVLSERKSLPSSGEILGFEVASHFGNLGCSWLCSGLEKDMYREFGIRPGQYGLIETFDDANRVYEWILEGEAKGEHRGEPEPYYP